MRLLKCLRELLAIIKIAEDEKGGKIIHIRLSQVQNIAGFAVENAREGRQVKVLSKASLISEQEEFYNYIDQISNIFLGRAEVPININNVCQFLVIIHKDLSADLYLNEFPVTIEIRSKRNIKKGETISRNDIADIGRLIFPNIKIGKTDKVIYCFKVGWKFALFF